MFLLALLLQFRLLIYRKTKQKVKVKVSECEGNIKQFLLSTENIVAEIFANELRCTSFIIFW